MNINDIAVLEIIDTNENGMGIAKKDKAVIFIAGAVKGDIAEVKIVSHEKNYYTAEIVKLISLSEYRIKPECCNFGSCGGCTLGNVSYEYENVIKKNAVIAAFRRAGVDYSVVRDTVYYPERKHYRNNISLHFDGEKFAYYASKTNDAVPFTGCLLPPSAFSTVANHCNSISANVKEYILSDIHIRDNCNGDITVSIYTEKAVNKDIAEALRDDFDEKFKSDGEHSHSLNFIFNNSGSSYIYDRIFGLEMRYSSEAFRQVNTKAFELLLEIVCSYASLCDFNFGADLYCGSGIIGLSVAKRMPEKHFIGIEINPDSISDAKYNAMKNGIDNIEYFVGDSSSLYNKVDNKSLPELVIVDPPRAGLSQTLCSDLIKISPSNIIYVSCNPQTLSRDLKFLTQNGYRIEQAVPVNLFPFTKHVETVCLLVRTNGLHIDIDVDVEEMLQEKRGQATYPQIKEYVLEQTGLKVSNLYISQVKRKCGLDVVENFNKPKSEDARVPQCPPEKEEAIMNALRHFGVI